MVRNSLIRIEKVKKILSLFQQLCLDSFQLEVVHRLNQSMLCTLTVFRIKSKTLLKHGKRLKKTNNHNTIANQQEVCRSVTFWTKS